MSFKSKENNILDFFYPYSNTKSNANSGQTTNFKINNVDISNNYVGIGTNSNIPVSQLYTNLGYYTYNNNPIETLFELNLPVFVTGSINTDFKMFPGNSGLLIQILKSTTLRFNYDLDCSFCMVGGGGGGGAGKDKNGNVGGGGGGGGGEVITGSIRNYLAGYDLSINIGDGGDGGIVTGDDNELYSGRPGVNTRLKHGSNTVQANGGSGGGRAKGSSSSTTGSSTGGTGAYSSAAPTVGTVTVRDPSSTTFGIFSITYDTGTKGSLGNDRGEGNEEDSGAGGGGGGAKNGGSSQGNDDPGNGGAGITQTYGTQPFTLGGGGGGGGRSYNASDNQKGNGGIGGADSGGNGGGGRSSSSATNGFPGTANTGGGGGGGQNRRGISSNTGLGGNGGSGTVIFYIRTSQVRL